MTAELAEDEGDTAGKWPTLLFSWEKGEERFVDTLRATPDLEKGDLLRKSLTNVDSGTKVQSRIIPAVIANLSLSARQPYPIYCA